MSKQMKLLMENFNKFIDEEMGMEGNVDSAIDSVLDNILDDALMESLLKEFGPVSAEDMAEFEGSDKSPSKEDIKSGIKQIVKSPEAQKAAAEIEQKAGTQAGFKEYAKATKNAIQSGALQGLGMVATTIPVFGAIGGLLGGALMEPHHTHSSWLDDPERINQAMDAAAVVGAQGGAAIGSILLAMAIAFVVGEVKKNAGDLADGESERNIRFPRMDNQ